ncbi:MAG: patatin-like phospholipase family protein [Polaribacter sp.]
MKLPYKHIKRKILLLLIILPMFIFGQQKQPKVGLVLSGGGAKGFSHIGVLKEIDKAGIQIDYIGGTSMGAIVGALYAIGYTGIQIEKIVKENDFMSIVRDQLPRSSSPFFEKEYGENTAFTLPVKKGVIGLPRAVSKGQNILNLLLELFAPVENVTDFSKFQTPFFCIATNVETGEEALLEKGSLPLAVRASGSFPTLLNPVELDNQLLIDGGVANNFPVDIMRSKNMDIIIGVDVQGKLFEKDKLTSVVSILNQIVSYKMYAKNNEKKDKIDVYIHPEIDNYGVVDFDKKDEILKKGEEVAKKFKNVFKEIAAKQKNKKVKKKLEIDTYKYLISEINMVGFKNYTRSYVLGKLNIKETDSSITRNEITKKIHLLSATKNYNQIKYTLHKKQDNSYKLNIFLKENDEKGSLKLGVHYDLLYKSGVLANYSQKHLLINNDLFSLDVILGDNLRYKLNYFVDNGFYISYGFRSNYNYFRANTRSRTIFPLTSNIKSINLKYTDFTNQFFFQTTFDRKFALGLGIEHKNIKASTETLITNNQESVFDKSNYLSPFVYLKLDTYDDRNFPTKGYFADLNAKWYLSSSDYNNNFTRFLQAKGTLGLATRIANKFTFQYVNEVGFTFNNPTSNIFDFYLGGYNKNYINTFVSFYGYDFAELSNKTFLKSEFTFRYHFSNNHYALFIANYGRLNENVFKDINIFKEIKSGYALGYSWNTFIGPVELKYSWSPNNNENYWLFNLGFWF